MYHSLRILLAPSILALAVASAATAAEPGYVDFGKFTGPNKGRVVEVTLGKGMLRLASFFARHHEPEASALIAGLSRVKVNVFGLDDSNRDSTMERLKTLQDELGRQGWEQIVAVHGLQEEQVAIFVKHGDGETIDGIVVTVIDERKNEAVFVNVVGRIKAEQIGALGAQLNIKQLQGAGKSRRA